MFFLDVTLSSTLVLAAGAFIIVERNCTYMTTDWNGVVVDECCIVEIKVDSGQHLNNDTLWGKPTDVFYQY